MTSAPSAREPQLPSNNALALPASVSGWFNRITRRLSVSQKISYGYGIALGIAICGTVGGFIIGDRYQQKAIEARQYANQELNLLHSLQEGVLKARSHQQQFIPLTQNPEMLQDEYLHFLEHAAETEQVLAELKAYANSQNYQNNKHADGLPGFIQTYEAVPETYLRQVKKVVSQIDPVNLTLDKREAAQKLLLDFTNGPVALKFDGLSDQLTEVIKLSYQDAQYAESTLTDAERLRFQIVTASILLSVATAILLAIYTSRAIARPIRAVTHVAQRATQESNFDLQAPVSSEDEVGALTASLNLLILKVNHLLEEQKAEAQATLMQSEKMSSLGRMMAGVAHEINNPVNFIYGNTIHASEYIKELLDLLETYQSQVPNPPQAVTDIAEEIDVEFLKEDLPKLLESMKFGAERAKAIVLSLKDFSRLDEATPNSVDLHGCIDSSLLILNSRIKKGINVVRSYGDIPAIEGYAGLLYQVFMNLMSNAIDAIEETKNPKSSGLLAITTQRLDQDWVMVRIADSGSGITSENQAKIFDAFFTTKPRGVGTGLGLSISHQIVVEKHGGKLSCQSEVGVGTSFAIALPIKHTPVAPVAASQLIRHLA